MITYAPIMRPISRQMSHDELAASLTKSIAQHEANRSTATALHDTVGIKIATRGIAVCRKLLASVTTRRLIFLMVLSGQLR